MRRGCVCARSERSSFCLLEDEIFLIDAKRVSVKGALAATSPE